jgi:DnaK suppressor protein
MEPETARSMLDGELSRLREQLAAAAAVGRREAEDRQTEGRLGDDGDSAQSLVAEGIDDALAKNLRRRLAAVERALERIDEGTYGRSVQSAAPIPDERLRADPAAELTVEEAARDQNPRS